MLRQTTTLLTTLIFALTLAISGCGGSSDPTPRPPAGDPTPTTNLPPTGGLTQPITENICAARGDVDTDGDGICDRDEIANPALSPTVADSDGDGLDDGDDDEGFWDNNWNRALVIVGTAAAVWAYRSCDDGQPGCDFWPWDTADTDYGQTGGVHLLDVASNFSVEIPMPSWGVFVTKTQYDPEKERSILEIRAEAHYNNATVKLGSGINTRSTAFCMTLPFAVNDSKSDFAQQTGRIQMQGGVDVKKSAKLELRNVTKNAVYDLCDSTPGVFVAFQEFPDRADGWYVKGVNPKAIGFEKTGVHLNTENSSDRRIEYVNSSDVIQIVNGSEVQIKFKSVKSVGGEYPETKLAKLAEPANGNELATQACSSSANSNACTFKSLISYPNGNEGSSGLPLGSTVYNEITTAD